MSFKGGTEATSGYRYYFSVLAGICRGPVDSVFLIKADGKIFYDTENTDNAQVAIDAPNLFGGDKGQGGLSGFLELYFGARDQVISFASYLRSVMIGLRVPQMRGVLTAFYKGEICANDPYPKPWQYRVRRALKGWHNDECWYPEKAVILLTDPALPDYVRGVGVGPDQNGTTITTLVDAEGNPTSDPTAATSTVTSTYTQQTVSTYVYGQGTTISYNVPAAYNQIYAMNGAHIIYECVTNPDWGRGLPTALVDDLSFRSAADTLYSEGFGLCLKWSRQEDIDVFVQAVIDHIGAAVYTNPVTGLLAIKLIREDYDISALPVFDYEHGLLEVTSIQSAAQDAVANEIIVKYHSPVLDMDKEARVQNIASINSLASFFTVNKDFSGIPTSTLALKAAARELRVNSGGWKRVEFKVDRRGFTIVPGDVFKITAPDHGIHEIIVRVATVDHSEIKDGSIGIVAAQDVYGWPLHAPIVPQQSTFKEVNRYPEPVTIQNISNATYRDTVKFANMTNTGFTVGEQQGGIPVPDVFGGGQTYVAVMAESPTPVSIAYGASVKREDVLSSIITYYDVTKQHDYKIVNYLNFQRLSVLENAIGVGDTTFTIRGKINSSNALIGGCYMMCDGSITAYTAANAEFVRLESISTNPYTGVTTVTVARGCVDTPALPHIAASRFWAYDESGGLVKEAFGVGDDVFVKCLTHTVSMGDLDPSLAAPMGVVAGARAYRPYSGAGFKVNGFFRDQVPPQGGDLVCTWHHRNRLTMAEHLFGENEADVAPAEPGTVYGVSVNGTFGGAAADPLALNGYDIPVIYNGDHVFASGTTDNTIVITRANLIAAGIVTGPLTLIFRTGRATPAAGGPIAYWIAERSVTCIFQYIVDEVPIDTHTSGGFNYDFGNNFSGG